MEKMQARTLAYNLAKELDVSDLDEVAGGKLDITLELTNSISGKPGCLGNNKDYKPD
jgi:hypothetical protein